MKPLAEHQEDAPDEVVQVHAALWSRTPPGHQVKRLVMRALVRIARNAISSASEAHERPLAALVGDDQVVEVPDREQARDERHVRTQYRGCAG